MTKIIASIAPVLLACALAIGSFLICARMFHISPIATKVTVTVIFGTTALTLIVAGVLSLFRSKPE